MAPLLAPGRNRNSMLLWTYVPIFALLEEVEPNGLYIALRSLTTGTILPTMCQLLVCRPFVGYNTANNVSNFGGDPVTQLIVNVYQMIKL